MSRLAVPRLAFRLLLPCMTLLAGPAFSTPLDFITVGDPLEDEIRLLEVVGPSLRLPHLGMRPLQIVDLSGVELPDSGTAAVSSRRVRRALARDLDRPGGEVPGTSPRLLQLAYPEDKRLELSVGFEGGGRTAK